MRLLSLAQLSRRYFFVATGDPVWNAPTWGEWEAEPGDNPAVCLGGNSHVTNLVDEVTDGAITYGAVTATGAAHLYVNGEALS